MNFRNFISLLLIASCASPKANNLSSPAAVQKFAIVDVQEIERSSVFIKDLQKSIFQREKKIGMELMEKKNSIENQYKLLTEKRSTLSQEALQAQGAKLEQAFHALQDLERDYTQALDFSKAQIGKVFTDKVVEFASDLAKDQNIFMVIPRALALYYDEDSTIDLTNDVLKRINSIKNIADFSQIFEQAMADLRARKGAKK